MKLKTLLLTIIILLAVGLLAGNPVVGGISLLLIFLTVVFFIGVNTGKRMKKPEDKTPATAPANPPINISVTSGDGSYFCKIAGIQYRCDTNDVGGFLGWVSPEPENAHDKNAVAIYRNDGKHLGYIPKDELKEFRKWSGCKRLPCVGFIKSGNDIPLFGKVKICDDSYPEEAQLHVVKFVRWMVSNIGMEFIPTGFSINTNQSLHTKQDTLDMLDMYIQEKESNLYEDITSK